MNFTKKLTLALIAGWMIQLTYSEAANTVPLFDSIYGGLTNACPNCSPDDLHEKAGLLTGECENITNQMLFTGQMAALLLQVGVGDLTNAATAAAVAADIAKNAGIGTATGNSQETNIVNKTNLPPYIWYGPGPVPTNVAPGLITNASSVPNIGSITNQLLTNVWGNPSSALILNPTKTTTLPYMVFFTAGAEFQNPYSINTFTNNTAKLTNNGSRTIPFIEFDYVSKWVLRTPRMTQPDSDGATGPGIFGGYAQNPFAHIPDIKVNLGFAFSTGTTPSNYTAATLAGSGNYYTEGGVGLPIWRFAHTSSRQQVSLDLAGGFSTDSEFLAIHPNAFVGLGYQTSFTVFYNTSSNTCGYFASRVGEGWTDEPSLTGSGSGVNVNGLGNPCFNLRPSVAIETELLIPLTSSIFLTAESDVFLQSRPGSWQIKVGATIPIHSIGSIFRSLISGSSN